MRLNINNFGKNFVVFVWRVEVGLNTLERVAALFPKLSMDLYLSQRKASHFSRFFHLLKL
jgi:hypothetical protein